MFLKKILVPKTEEEKMVLKAKRDTLKGIKNEFKNYELHGAWELDNVAVSKDYLETRFGSIENAAKCLYQPIEKTPITMEENEALDDIDYKVKKVCIDDIKYTNHGKYATNLGVSFTRIQRLAQILKLERENPEYYTKQLKDPNFVENDANPIEIYFKEDENGNNFGTIVEGNNRIIKMKVDMARELSYTTDPKERDRIKEKYSIYVMSKDVKDIDNQKRK